MSHQNSHLELSQNQLIEAKRLSTDLVSTVEKLSRIVLLKLGKEGEKYKVITLTLPSDVNPLQVGFGGMGVLNREDIGYYIDPPGICTTVPAC